MICLFRVLKEYLKGYLCYTGNVKPCYCSDWNIIMDATSKMSHKTLFRASASVLHYYHTFQTLLHCFYIATKHSYPTW